MNEQRLQAYLNLINALLGYVDGGKRRYDNANSVLVDAGLVQAITQVAEVLQ